MKRVVFLLSIALAQGCASDSSDPERSDETADERAARKCREFIGALCSKYVECRAEMANGEVFSNEICEDAMPAAVSDCVSASGDAIAETSDADFDACTRAFGEQACTLVCGRVPEDPAECLALDDYEPQTLVVTCAP